MFKRYATLCLALASAGCAALGDQRPPTPTIENHLSDCVQVSPRGVRDDHGRWVLDAQVSVSQPIGVCGCMSALAAYHSVAAGGAERALFQRGEVNLKTGGLKSFELGGANTVGGADKISLVLMCAGPR